MGKMNDDAVLLLGYDRPIPGREENASNLIDELFAFLEQQKSTKNLDTYDAISLNVYGGDLNGFVLIRGKRGKLDELRACDEFDELMVKAHMLMTGVRVITGVHGELVRGRRMERIRTLASTKFV